MIDKEAIKARRDAATPGPWKWEVPFESIVSTAEPGYLTDVLSVNIDEYDSPYLELTQEDAELIVHAPTDIDNLLAEVEKLEGQVTLWKTRLNEEQVRLRAALERAKELARNLAESVHLEFQPCEYGNYCTDEGHKHYVREGE